MAPPQNIANFGFENNSLLLTLDANFSSTNFTAWLAELLCIPAKYITLQIIPPNSAILTIYCFNPQVCSGMERMAFFMFAFQTQALQSLGVLTLQVIDSQNMFQMMQNGPHSPSSEPPKTIIIACSVAGALILGLATFFIVRYIRLRKNRCMPSPIEPEDKAEKSNDILFGIPVESTVEMYDRAADGTLDMHGSELILPEK